MEKVYVVNMGYYGEWSYDCGSNSIIGVCSTLEGALKVFRKVIIDELFDDEERIIDEWENTIKIKDNLQDIKKLIDVAREKVQENGQYYVCEYINESYYQDGNNSAIIEIEEIELDKWVLIND